MDHQVSRWERPASSTLAADRLASTQATTPLSPGVTDQPRGMMVTSLRPVSSEITSNLSIAGRMSLASTLKPAAFSRSTYRPTANAKRNPRDMSALPNNAATLRRPPQPLPQHQQQHGLHVGGTPLSQYYGRGEEEVKSERKPQGHSSQAERGSVIVPPPRGLRCDIGRRFPKVIRRQMLQRPWLRPVSTMHIAAITIQTAWRRFRARRALTMVIEAVEQEKITRFLHKRLPMIAAWTAHGSAALDLTGLSQAQIQRLTQAQLQQQRQLQYERNHTMDSCLATSATSAGVTKSTDPIRKPGAMGFDSSIAAERERALELSRDLSSITESRKTELLAFLPYAVAAFVIQRAWRACLAGREGRKRALPLFRKHRAARAIQRAWRSSRDRRIFKHLKDLVLGRTLSDPIQLMKVICPSEAHIADAASGLYIRFRLGGPTFPPLLYYKIFTMRPVADIGAFAPRNYAAQSALAGALVQSHVPQNVLTKLVPKGLTVEQSSSSATGPSSSQSSLDAFMAACEEWERNRRKHKNHGNQSARNVDPKLLQLIESCKEWYRRCDNNGWKLVSGSQVVALNPKLERFLNMGQPRAVLYPEHPHPYFYTSAYALPKHRRGMADPVRWDISGQHPVARAVAAPAPGARPYHPDRLVRHVDVIRRKKRKKLKWLQSLYRLAMSGNVAGVVSSAHSGSEGSTEPHSDDDDCEESKDATDNVGINKLGGDIVLFDKSSVGDASVQKSKETAKEPPTLVGKLLLGADPQAEEVCMPAFWEELSAAAAEDEMITWATGLDFESYARDWGCLGTTRPARAPAPFDDESLAISASLESARNQGGMTGRR